MQKAILLFSVLPLAALTGCQREDALCIKEMVQSTRDNYFQRIDPSLSDEEAAESIVIDLSQTAQTLKGFGTCFNELAWASLSDLTDEERQTIFSELFEPGKGANLNRGRMSIGANDFALDYYSCDETEGDFELNDFNIERDKQTLLPMMLLAQKYNADMYWFASPWCPPRWMKKTGHYAERALDKKMVERMRKAMAEAKQAAQGPRPGEEGGVSATAGFFDDGPLAFRVEPTENDAIPGEEGYEGTTSFNMDSRYVDAYGRYFGKFVDAYRAEGVNLSMVMPQNEMNSNQNFPSCCWTSEDLATFVGKSLGPEMQKRGVEVYFGTCERPDPLLIDTILTDVDCQKYVTGVAFQWAGKDALPTIAQNYPQMDLVMSEQECGNGKNNWEGAMHSWDLQRHYLSNGVTQYYYWNTSLWYDKPSRWGWFQNSLITVNADDKSWTWTPEYYELKHLSHYALPGAKRLVLGGSYDDVLGFVNPDGSIVLAICNQTDADTTIALQLKGQQLTVTIPAHSLNTVKL